MLQTNTRHRYYTGPPSMAVSLLTLTGGEAASEEHVEEVFRSDVGLEAPVEVEAPSVRVARAAGLLSSRQVILPPFVWVAEHRVRVADLWKDRTA